MHFRALLPLCRVSLPGLHSYLRRSSLLRNICPDGLPRSNHLSRRVPNIVGLAGPSRLLGQLIVSGPLDWHFHSLPFVSDPLCVAEACPLKSSPGRRFAPPKA